MIAIIICSKIFVLLFSSKMGVGSRCLSLAVQYVTLAACDYRAFEIRTSESRCTVSVKLPPDFEVLV